MTLKWLKYQITSFRRQNVRSWFQLDFASVWEKKTISKLWPFTFRCSCSLIWSVQFQTYSFQLGISTLTSNLWYNFEIKFCTLSSAELQIKLLYTKRYLSAGCVKVRNYFRVISFEWMTLLAILRCASKWERSERELTDWSYMLIRSRYDLTQYCNFYFFQNFFFSFLLWKTKML